MPVPVPVPVPPPVPLPLKKATFGPRTGRRPGAHGLQSFGLSPSDTCGNAPSLSVLDGLRGPIKTASPSALLALKTVLAALGGQQNAAPTLSVRASTQCCANADSVATKRQAGRAKAGPSKPLRPSAKCPHALPRCAERHLAHPRGWRPTSAAGVYHIASVERQALHVPRQCAHNRRTHAFSLGGWAQPRAGA